MGTNTALEYAVQVINAYRQMFAARGVSVAGRNYLEIGPGIEFGPQILLADKGATVTLADPRLAEWDEDFHPAHYRALNRRLGPSPALERVIDQGSYDGVLRLVLESAEHLTSLPSGHFDVVMSNAVLEHVADIRAAAHELRRVSRPDAFHSHQVDFRYHRDFERPLEHLLWSRRSCRRRAKLVNFDFGCQMRPAELAAIFLRAGFKSLEMEPNAFATTDYLDEFIQRAQRKFSRSPYRRWSKEALRTVGARYYLTA